MNIYAKKGDKVVYTEQSAKNGHTYDQEECQKLLTIGTEYTVDHTDVYDCHTTVYLQEFPGRTFNSVMLEDVPKEPTEYDVAAAKRWREKNFPTGGCGYFASEVDAMLAKYKIN